MKWKKLFKNYFRHVVKFVKVFLGTYLNNKIGGGGQAKWG
jgi:hypothetical protein